MEPKLLNIMIVDDDNVDIMSLQRAFKKNNMANPLFIANDGVEALDMLRGTNGKEKIVPTPKIIISDINMPKMNGLEFIKELRADKDLHAISVFVLTTSNDDKDRIEAHNHNVAGYIIKPINMESFIRAVSVLHNYWQLVFNEEPKKDMPVMDATISNSSL
jgi:CheY-like chemotaxis protein